VVVLACSLVLAASACDTEDRREDGLVVSTSTAPLPQAHLPGATIPAYIAGDRLVLPKRAKPVRLEDRLVAPLLGQNVPLVLESPDGRFVLYHTWRNETPLLRLVEPSSGADVLFARGAQSAAWRSDGAIAYTEGTPPNYRPQRPWVGNVVVRTSLRSSPTVWTSRRGMYRVAGWTGSRLLVESGVSNVVRLGTPEGTLIYESPGRYMYAGLGGVSALSPDRRYFFGRVPNGDGPSDRVRIVDTATGLTVARGALKAMARRAGIDARNLDAGVYGAASWRGEYIAADTASGRTGTLVVLRFARGKLSLEHALRLDGSAGLHGRYGAHFSVPRLLDNKGKRVIVRVDVPGPDDNAATYFLTCDTEARECVRGRPVAPREWMALVER
jgi:hypothetical protein